MDIYIFSKELELIGHTDVVTSGLWTENFADVGTFEFWSPLDAVHAELFQEGNLVYMLEHKSAGVIELIEKESSDKDITMHIAGRHLKSYLDRRCVYPVFNKTAKPSEIARSLVNVNCIDPTDKNRVIPNLSLKADDPEYGTSMSMQKTGGSVLDAEVDFLTAQNLGSEVIFDHKNKKLLYSVRQGKDRRIDQDVNDPVLLSTDMDTILSSEYTYDKSEMKNFAYVAGAGEGAARKVISVSAKKTVAKLPDGYTELSYIQSSGTQYIDTGVKIGSSGKAIMDVEITSAPSSQLFVFGASTSGDNERYGVTYLPSQKYWRNVHSTGTGSMANFPTTLPAVGRHKIIKDRNKCTIDGEEMNAQQRTFTSTVNLYMLARNQAGTAQSIASAKVYSFQLYQNDVVVRDFIPCRNANNVVGMYDLVEGKFYGNSGTGAFTAGEAGSEVHSGLDRYELYVDARDIQDTKTDDKGTQTTIPDAEYNSMLSTRGLSKLAECKLSESFEATIRTDELAGFVFDKDYFLGDTITVYDNRLKVKADVLITAAEYKYTSEGQEVNLTLGYPQLSVMQKLRRDTKQ